MSVTIDPHKLGLAPIPCSALVVRDEERFRLLVFEAKYMSAKQQIGLLGTRSAGSIVAFWFLTKLLGVEGYQKLAEALMQRLKYLLNTLKQRGFNFIQPDVPIVCIPHEREECVLECLWNRGYYVYRCGLVKGIRIVLMPHVDNEYIDRFIEALQNCHTICSTRYA